MNEERQKKLAEGIKRANRKLTSTQYLLLGYLIVILLGAFLLCLPIASRSREWTGYLNSLFTATSATCVTGLIVFDTWVHWSIFGQIVILAMIQIGGIGFMTIITLFSMFLRRQIGVFERKILMQSAGTMRLTGIVLLIRHILIGTLICETAGTLLLMTRFCPKMGFGTGLYNAVFHSVSAFCNAGFDLMGKYQPFSSLTVFAGDAVVNLTIMALIVTGGIGFVVWSDLFEKKGRFRKFSLHTKMVLISTAILILVPAALYFVLEYDRSFAGMTVGEKILAALFQSVSPRTAGFNTVELSSMSDASVYLSVLLMIVGGSPGSTAGGLKTTTIIVIFLSFIAAARNSDQITIGKRRLEDGLIRRASGLFIFYLAMLTAGTFIICAIEPFSLKEIMYEVASALGTVGLTLGITPQLTWASKLILIFLMFAGRVGALTVALAFGQKRENPPLSRPAESILIG